MQQDFLHDPLGSSEQLRKYLLAADELRGVGSTLSRRHAEQRTYEEYMLSLDRQLAEVEKTRKVIAAACPPRNPHNLRPRSFPEPGGVHCEAVRMTNTSSSPTLAETGARSLQHISAPRPKAKVPAVVELRAFPCPNGSVGEECPCCLCQLQLNDLVMCFPCPAEHAFHSHCLTKWLRSAGNRSTCPVCRAWPKPKAKKQVSPVSVSPDVRR